MDTLEITGSLGDYLSLSVIKGDIIIECCEYVYGERERAFIRISDEDADKVRHWIAVHLEDKQRRQDDVDGRASDK